MNDSVRGSLHAAPPLTRRQLLLLAAGILLLALCWRLAIASALPSITRDSVTFCHYAEQLGQHGLPWLRTDAAQQHPLYPALLLGTQRVAVALGAPDAPLTWQRSGQAVSLSFGLLVVLLSGVLAHLFIRRTALPIDARLAACGAMLITAILPLNVWLSVEAMSDQIHAAFYLAGAIALLDLDRRRAALLCGAASAAAFLTRPEGIVVAIAGFLAIAANRSLPIRRRAGHAMLLLAAFGVLAGPYSIYVGTLSPKKSPLDWVEPRDETAWRVPSRSPADATATDPIATATIAPPVAAFSAGDPIVLAAAALLARLELLDLPWYAVLPYALYGLFRAGRVVVLLLALPPLLQLGRRLLQQPLLGLTLTGAGHFALTLLLLVRYEYLQPRHMLVLVLLLVPLAAALTARLIDLGRSGRWPLWVAGGVVGLLLLPLGVYSSRVPNAADQPLIEAAGWLERHDPDISDKTLLSGTSARRIAFYTGATWEYWFEDANAYTALLRRIEAVQPDYFLIETGAGFERAGNDALVAKLRDERRLQQHIAALHRLPVYEGQLHVFQFAWPDPKQP